MNTETIETTTDQCRKTIDNLRPIWQEIEKLIETELTDAQKLSLTICLDYIEKIMLNNMEQLKTNLNKLKGLTQ